MMTVLNFFLYIWLLNTIHEFGGINRFFSFIGVLLIALYVSVYYLIFFIAIKKIAIPLLYPVIFLLLELIRGSLFTGFTFNLMGYSLYKLRFLIIPARYYTVYGVGFFIVFVSLMLAHRKRVSAFLWLFILVYFLPILFIGQIRYPGIDISLLQTSFAPEDKRMAAMDVFFEHHYFPTVDFFTGLDEKPDLVVWSETAIPYKIKEHSYTEHILKEFVGNNKVSLITGTEYQEDDLYYNTSLFMSKDGDVKRYHKMHLVPFGEFFPFRNIGFFNDLYGQFIDFSRGREPVIFEVDGEKIFTPICYEIAFGSIVRRAVKRGAEVIINISNDAWYGFSSGPVAEIPFAVFRAIESEVWVLRAINRGWGVVVDPAGRILYKNDPRKWGFITVRKNGSIVFTELQKEPPADEIINNKLPTE